MSRTRSTVDFSITQGPYSWVATRKNGTIASTLVTSDVWKRTRSIVDNVTPDYLGKLSRGEFLPINEVTISTVEEKYTSVHSGTDSIKNWAGAASTAIVTYAGANNVFISGATLPAFTISQSDIDAVVIKAMAAAKQPDWDLLTFIGEFPQTVKLIAKRIRGVNRIAKRVARRASRRELRRSRRKRVDYDPNQALKDFLELWLEARYGWRPLVYDIQSMIKALKHKSLLSIQRKSAKLTVPVTASAGPAVSDNTNFKYTLNRTRVGSVKLRAVVFYKGDMSPIGFNPVITAWELTRYSFVVDWFINIGGWIQAMSPRIGYDQLGVSVSTVADYYESAVQVATEGSAHTWSVGLTDLTYINTVKTYHRWSYSGIPLPSIQVNLNPLKIIDLIALALQGRGDVARALRL